MTTIIIIAITLLIGFIIGQIYSYFKNRRQCPDCGSFKTHQRASVYGSVKGGKYPYAIKHWEGHICKGCDCVFSVSIKK